MRRVSLTLAAVPLLLATHGMALAQDQSLREGIRFTLKSRPSVTAVKSDPVPRERMSRLVPVLADDRGDGLEVMVKRQKSRTELATLRDAASPSLAPRSRFVLLTVKDRAPVGDHFTVVAGFQGMKLINRGANVTAIASSDRIRARDWFMPRAAIELTSLPNVDLTLRYDETLRAYGETGRSGTMGLPHEEFRTLVRTLRPERQKRLRLDGRWTASPAMTLAITAFGGQISDRLSFADRSYLPQNGGSGRMTGIVMAISRQATPRWRLSMGYSESWLDPDHGGHAKERSLSAEAGWNDGPWRWTLRATRSGMPALLADAAHGPPRVRVEGEMRYRLPRGSLSLRMTDPDRLASTAILHDATGLARAADQARGLMLDVVLDW